MHNPTATRSAQWLPALRKALRTREQWMDPDIIRHAIGVYTKDHPVPGRPDCDGYSLCDACLPRRKRQNGPMIRQRRCGLCWAYLKDAGTA